MNPFHTSSSSSSTHLSFSIHSIAMATSSSSSFSTFSLLSRTSPRVPIAAYSRSSLPSLSRLSESSLSSHFLSHFLPITQSNFPKGRNLSSRLNVQASADKKKVLIVNTNSGGHAVIGFYFAKELLASGHDVTVLTVGEEASDKMKKTPFTRFSELTNAGGKTIWGKPSEVGNVVGGATFDVVLDNNGKDLDTVKKFTVVLVNSVVTGNSHNGIEPIMQKPNRCDRYNFTPRKPFWLISNCDDRNWFENDRPVADWAKSASVSQFLFISSAGIYKTSDEVPHVEGDPVKEDAGHVAVEKYLESLSFPSWAAFRPQYMIGSGNNKDCEEWFFDRIVRNRPVPIPGSGMQLTSISHVRDLSSMLTLAVEKPEAANHKIFNCVCDRAVTFNGLAKLCAQAAGSELKIVYFDPKEAGVDPRKAFPFRIMHFYAEPRAAKGVLGWTSTTNLPEDLKERFAEYISIGRDKKEIKFDVDNKILDSLKVPAGVSS